MTERPHGRWRYKLDGCRCFTCRRAYADYSAACRRGEYLRAETHLPAVMVRERLEALTAAGVDHLALAQFTGLSVRLLRDWRDADRQIVRADLAARLLAVDVADVPALPPVQGSAFRRRLQALVALGWSSRDLAAALSVSEPNLSRLFRLDALPATRRAIARLYDDLSMQVPAESTATRRARSRGRRLKWFPPLAWDDEAIDDPDALPCLLPPVEPVERDLELTVQHVAAGHDVEVPYAVRLEVVRRRPAAGRRELADMCRCSVEQIRRTRQTLAESC